MEDIIGQVLAVIIFGGLIIMAAYYSLDKSRGHNARQQAADQRGWEYQAITKTVNFVLGENSDSPDGSILYRLLGKLSDASPWQIETRFRHETNNIKYNEESASWQTRSFGTPNLYIHITPKSSLGVTVIGGDKDAQLKNISLQNGLFSLGQDLNRLGMNPPTDILSTFQQFEIDSEGWQEKYNLFSTDEAAARSLLKSKLLSSALLDWALQNKQPSRCPTVTFCPQGVQIMLGWTVKKVDTLDQLVALGEIAANASKCSFGEGCP